MDENSFLEYLILEGALEVAALDVENGEPLYRFTDKLHHISPELYDQHLNMFYSDVMELWQRGFLNINLESQEPVVSLTEKSFDIEAVKNLDKDKRYTLNEIIRLISQEY